MFTPEEVKHRVEDVLEIMEITKLRDRSPHTLSGGEKKKVCIATVLVNNPDVLLLDEPTAGLDPRTQLWLVELLQELGRSGKTVITATHDLETIEQISKRAVVMGEDHGIKVDGDTVKCSTTWHSFLVSTSFTSICIFTERPFMSTSMPIRKDTNIGMTPE